MQRVLVVPWSMAAMNSANSATALLFDDTSAAEVHHGLPARRRPSLRYRR
jgi:hypothetical protein